MQGGKKERDLLLSLMVKDHKIGDIDSLHSINLMSLCAQFSNNDLLKEIIQSNVDYLIDVDNRSPAYYL